MRAKPKSGRCDRGGLAARRPHSLEHRYLEIAARSARFARLPIVDLALASVWLLVALVAVTLAGFASRPRVSVPGVGAISVGDVVVWGGAAGLLTATGAARRRRAPVAARSVARKERSL